MPFVVCTQTQRLTKLILFTSSPPPHCFHIIRLLSLVPSFSPDPLTYISLSQKSEASQQREIDKRCCFCSLYILSLLLPHAGVCFLLFLADARMASFTHEDLRRVVLRDLPDQFDEELIHELCTQFGPIASIHRPHSDTDLSGTARQAGFCFVDFYSPEDAKYCYQVLKPAHVKVFDKPINVFHASVDIADRESGRRHSSSHRSITALHEVGAKVLIRNVDNTATEYDLTRFFEQYGRFAAPPRMRRDSEGNFRGTVVFSYQHFSASDRLIREMDQRVYRDRVISVQYAELEDGSGRLHGTPEERANADLINTMAREHQAKIDADTAAFRQQTQQSRAKDTSWADASHPQGRGQRNNNNSGGGGRRR